MPPLVARGPAAVAVTLSSPISRLQSDRACQAGLSYPSQNVRLAHIAAYGDDEMYFLQQVPGTRCGGSHGFCLTLALEIGLMLSVANPPLVHWNCCSVFFVPDKDVIFLAILIPRRFHHTSPMDGPCTGTPAWTSRSAGVSRGLSGWCNADQSCGDAGGSAGC
jgi:hypothetical protein